MYTLVMDVAITDLRAHLSEWLERARNGNEVVVTDRGIPVARILGLNTTTMLEQLTDEGVIAKPLSPNRPRATGRRRPRPRHSVAERVGEQRR